MNDYIIRKYSTHSIVYSYETGFFHCVPNTLVEDFVGKRLKAGTIEIPIDRELIESITSPVVIGMMYSNVCNLDCRYCIAKNGKGYSKTNTLSCRTAELVKRISASDALGLLVSGGEPTLNASIIPLLKELSECDLYVTLDSNGIGWSDELIKVVSEDKSIVVRISLDSEQASIHNANRGRFDHTIKTIKALISKGKYPRINTVLHNGNCRCLRSFADFLISLGIAKWHIYKVQGDFAPEDLIIDDGVAAKAVSDLLYYVGDKIKVLCKFTSDNDGFASFVIDSEGNAFSSDNKNHKKVVFGNIFSRDISDVWRSAPYDYRLRHIKKYVKFIY